MQNIIFYNKDKTVNLFIPSHKSIFYGDPTKMLKRVLETNPQFKGLDYEWINSEDLPQDREFRSCWEGEKGKGITINEAKKTEQIKESLIQAKIKENHRKQAIIELEAEGKI